MKKQRVEIDGRVLQVSNLEKVLFPDVSFTKAQVIDYYVRVAPVLLPHVTGRPMSFQRFPDGTATKGFFAKNAPRGTPDWVRTVKLPAPGSTMDRETLDYVVVDDLPTLVWAANLAGLELHVPQWSVGPRGGVREPDRLVLDLDPGEPATAVECAEIAMLLRELVEADGLSPLAKTSGSKGMQVYAAVQPVSDRRTSDYAKDLAQRLEKSHPKLVVSQMRKELRRGKVFVDWSQNTSFKTTVNVYSLRARDRPTVSTPLTWDEVREGARAGDPERLVFDADAVRERVAEHGDLFGPVVSLVQQLPAV
jgi:bifunctional non-homologous end joining protein LigD